ncbi:MAG: class I SAM-dependent methyltransferase [Verrucomicrobiae bacterium]|nr:class I SAM-dependent methyltransferase [Verrucomicrobiae bacterium]NNJ42562.1 class I SAM-dependent methyltransferase [Akkermansiaceae bacterium]
MESNDHQGAHHDGGLLFKDLIAHNYMCHSEITKSLRSWAWKQEKRSLRILDLGCGDGSVAQAAFDGVDHIQYYGIDIASNLLAIARTHFEPSHWSIELLHGDLTEMIQQLHGPFDFVLAGYALSYLDNKQKSSILDNIRLVLSPHGTLMIYDLLPRTGERHDDFIQRLLQDAEANWDLLSREQHTSFRQHLENRAFPIDQAELQQLAYKSSLGKGELIFRDKAEHYGLISFSH